MTVADRGYAAEMFGALRAAGVRLYHFTLVAQPEAIRRRMHARPEGATAWAEEQVDYCVQALRHPSFAVHIATDDRDVGDTVAEIERVIQRARARSTRRAAGGGTPPRPR